MIIARAPLRIPLGGGGTDFPSYYKKYGGYILGFALDRYVHVMLHQTLDKKVRLKYSKIEEVDNVDELENRVAAEALKYYGVTEGIEIVTFSDVPESSGLGGSSSFCVALVVALRQLLGLPSDKYITFASAYDIERNKAGIPGGIQDQYFASMGGAWALDLGDNVEERKIDISSLLPKLKLVGTGLSRSDLSIASNQDSRTLSGDEDILLNLGEVKRLGKRIEKDLEEKDLSNIGNLFKVHWENKKLRDPGITNPFIDTLYSNLLLSGALGGKLLGLGGGGYFLVYSDNGLGPIPSYPVGVDEEGAKVVYEVN